MKGEIKDYRRKKAKKLMRKIKGEGENKKVQIVLRRKIRRMRSKIK